MSVEDNKIIVLRFLEDVWGNGNMSIVDEMIANNHVHHLSRRDVYGPEGVRQLVSWLRTFLPDLQITIHDLVAEADKVVIYFSFSGTDKGGYRDHPPSGNSVTYRGIDIFRVAGGKIVERWGIVDTISMMYQIGAIT
ncbi:MAG: ester cyclase [Anaerolineales bacterium]|jgi:predicted ester cyclase